MSIEDRLRESLARRTGAPSASEDAWGSIQRGIDRRRQRTRTVRVVGGAIVAAAFVAAATWGGLALRDKHPVIGHP